MIRLTAILFTFLLFTSCGKDDSTEYEESRNQIIGTWLLQENVEIEDIGQVGNPIDKSGVITFSEDGTGNSTSNFNIVTNFEWLYQLSPEKVSILTETSTTSSSPFTLGENRHFDVVENRSTLQNWIAYDNASFYIDSTIQTAPREIRWEMIKQ